MCFILCELWIHSKFWHDIPILSRGGKYLIISIMHLFCSLEDTFLCFMWPLFSWVLNQQFMLWCFGTSMMMESPLFLFYYIITLDASIHTLSMTNTHTQFLALQTSSIQVLFTPWGSVLEAWNLYLHSVCCLSSVCSYVKGKARQ